MALPNELGIKKIFEISFWTESAFICITYKIPLYFPHNKNYVFLFYFCKSFNLNLVKIPHVLVSLNTSEVSQILFSCVLSKINFENTTKPY